MVQSMMDNGEQASDRDLELRLIKAEVNISVNGNMMNGTETASYIMLRKKQDIKVSSRMVLLTVLEHTNLKKWYTQVTLEMANLMVSVIGVQIIHSMKESGCIMWDMALGFSILKMVLTTTEIGSRAKQKAKEFSLWQMVHHMLENGKMVRCMG